MKQQNRVLLLVVTFIASCVVFHSVHASDREHPTKLPLVKVVAEGGGGGASVWGMITSNSPGNSIGVGGSGGGSAHTSDNQQSTANQKHSKNPKSDCDKGDGTTSAATSSDPIDLSTGSKIEKVTDFALPGEMGLTFERYYNSKFTCVGGSCVGSIGTWTTNLDYALHNTKCAASGGGGTPLLVPNGVSQPIPCPPVTYTRPDGSVLSFASTFPFTGGVNGFVPVPGPFNDAGTATLANNHNGTFTLHDEDAQTLTFNNDGQLLSITDPSGIGWTFTHPTTTTTVVTHTNGRSFTVALAGGSYGSYGTARQINVTDPAGHVYVYHATAGMYDSYTSPTARIGVIQSETLPGSPATQIAYQYLPDNTTAHAYAQLSEVDYNGVPHDLTTYDSAWRANMSRMADGTQKTTVVYGATSTGPTATVTNPLGHVAVYQFDNSHLLLSVTGNAATHCAASFSHNTYDTNGNLASSADNNGTTTTYVYAANGLLQKKVEAAGTSVQRTTDLTWDTTPGMDRPLTITIEGLVETDFTYDSHNRLASQKVKNLTATGTANQTLTTSYAYTYYANGTLHTHSVTHPSPSGGDKDTYTYDAYGNVTTVADGLGHVTTYSNYNALGLPGQVSGPNGDVTNYSYDARGRIASIVRHPNGVAATWSTTYDGFGLPASTTAPDGATVSVSRNPYMQVTSITRNDKDGSSTESFAYDANGDVTTHTLARGSDIGIKTTATYDALGRLYQQHGMHGQSLTYAYDTNDNVVSVTDALGHATAWQYDALDRITRSTDANSGITKYTYDLADDVATVTDPRGLVTAYAYDGLGLLWGQSSPDTGTTTFAYDTYGRRTGMTRANGVTTSYGYDTLGRRTSLSAGGQTQTFSYDSCTHGIGRLCADSDATGTTSYAYTPEGWISTRSFSIGGTSYALGYGYDNHAHLASVTYPDGNQAHYTYTHGVVSGVTLTVGGTSVNGATAITYRPGDLAMAGWTSSNGLINTLGHDSDGRLTSIGVPGIQSLSFGYDAANRITHLTNGIDGSMTETVGYDALSQLTSLASTADNETYHYDADGNRLTGVVNGASITYTPAATSNRLVSVNSTAYGFDAQGNTTTQNSVTTYQYNPFNRLSQSGGATNYINPEGQRLRKAGGATGTTYFAPDANGALLAENDNGTWVDYVRLNGRLIGRLSGGQVQAIHTDQVGRPEVVTDAAHTVIWRARNTPFDRSVTQGSIMLNLGFPGQYYDAETGLWHNGYRDYGPTMGRYVESDPIGLGGGLNTYAYVKNNPLTHADPHGLEGVGSWNNGGNPTIFETGNILGCNMDQHFYRNGMAAMGMVTGFAIGTTAVVSLMSTPETMGESDVAGGKIIEWLIMESPEPYATASIVGGSGGAAAGAIAGGLGGAVLDGSSDGKTCKCH